MLLKNRPHCAIQQKKWLYAKFADHTLSEAGKLSFKERDVSFFLYFPTLSNSVSRLLTQLLLIGLFKLLLSAGIDSKRNTFFIIFLYGRHTNYLYLKAKCPKSHHTGD